MNSNQDFFLQPGVLAQKQHEALRMYFIERKPAKKVARNFGHTYRGFTTLVFYSKFNNCQNPGKLNKQEIKFVTIRRRRKNMMDKIENIPSSNWKTLRVEIAGNKKRTIKVHPIDLRKVYQECC